MKGERVAYGTSLGFVSRRLFVLGAVAALAAICAIEICSWFLRSRLWDRLSGSPERGEQAPDCTGQQCFEMFTCFGLKETTLHLREPVATASGLLVLPFGVVGALHGYRGYLRLLGGYLAASAVLRAALIAGDLGYVRACGMYPTNIMDQAMLNWLPPSPVTNAAQGRLRQMAAYSFVAVARLTDDFPVLWWYLAVACGATLSLAYLAREALLLGDLAERGPLGLGPCYGVQWDQVPDHAAFARMTNKQTRSQFIDDCTPYKEDAGEPPELFRGFARALSGAPRYGAADPLLSRLTPSPEESEAGMEQARADGAAAVV